MAAAVWGFLGAVIGGLIAASGNLIIESKKFKLSQKAIWGERRYEVLRQMLQILDRLILFSYSSNRSIYQLEEITLNQEQEYDEICKARKAIMPDIMILFDSSVKQEFETVFEDVYEGRLETHRNQQETGYRDIVDEVNAFADKVRKKYFDFES